MQKQRGKAIAEKFIVLFTICLYVVVYYLSPDKAIRAISYSADIFFDVILLVLAAICLGGLAKATLPRELIARFLGQERGATAYFTSILAAAIMPGEWYTRIPLFEALLDRGAALGPFTSLCTCRPLFVNFPQGVAFLGLPIAIIQVISTMIGALCAGIFAAIVQRKVTIVPA
ncbi:MAG: hypothetical protein KKI07_00815 [Euryarchaeota archaeon]|nr:hypothetical protein [Euryarchaeota archaeon]